MRIGHMYLCVSTQVSTMTNPSVCFLFEWRFYALSASKVILRARTYSHKLFSPVMITWWMKLGGNRPPGHDALLVSISGPSGTGFFICPCSHTDTAGHTKAFDKAVKDHCPVSRQGETCNVLQYSGSRGTGLTFSPDENGRGGGGVPPCPQRPLDPYLNITASAR